MKPLLHTYELEFVTQEDHARRAVAFLISDNDKITAKNKFLFLKGDDEKFFRTKFDVWVDWKIKTNWYHGWDSSEFGGQYAKCFVFKHKSHRFYGFLCNPKLSNPGYQVCVLVIYARKNEWKTDLANLKKVEEIRTTISVQETIRRYFKVRQ